MKTVIPRQRIPRSFLSEAERRNLISKAFVIRPDADGYEHFEVRPGVARRDLDRAHSEIKKRRRLLAAFVWPAPAPESFRVWHLNKSEGWKPQVHYLSTTHNTPASRQVRVSDLVKEVEDYRKRAPAEVFTRLLAAALDGLRHTFFLNVTSEGD